VLKADGINTTCGSAKYHRQYFMTQGPECLNGFPLVGAVTHFTNDVVGWMRGKVNDAHVLQRYAMWECRLFLNR